MGLNVTGGTGCGIESSEIAGAYVVLSFLSHFSHSLSSHCFSHFSHRFSHISLTFPSSPTGNGDAGVVLDGGDRQMLTPSGHYVTGCTSHHNQRWIMNYAPDVMLAGVGATITDTEIYGSPQIAVFFQGNDHSLTGGSVHDAGRQCSDCGAFYMGREWTYRGNSITGVTFANLSSIFGKAHGEPSAIYLDDQLSSVTVDSCTFIQVEGCVMLLGGGRDNHFTNNSKHTSNLPLHICCCVSVLLTPYLLLSACWPAPRFVGIC